MSIHNRFDKNGTSSNVNEVIRAVLNLFYKTISYTHTHTNTQQHTHTHKHTHTNTHTHTHTHTHTNK